MKLKILFLLILIWQSFTFDALSQEEELLTLDDCIRMALSKGIDVQLSELAYHKAKLEFARTCRDLQMPKINLSGSGPSYSRSSIERSVYVEEADYWKDVWVDQTTTRYSTSLELTQRIFTGADLRLSSDANQYTTEYTGSISKSARLQSTVSIDQPLFRINNYKTSWQSAHRNLENSTQSYWNALRDVMSKATTFFFEALIAQKRFDLEKQSLEQYQNAYQIEKQKFEQGLTSELTLLEAEINVNNAEIADSQYKEEVVVVMQKLKDMLQLTAAQPITLKEPLIKIKDIDWEFYLEKSLEKSPAVANKKEALTDRHQDLDEAEDKNNLSLDLSGSYGYESEGKTFEEASKNWDWKKERLEFRLAMRMPLWDGGVTSREIQIAKAELKMAELELEQEQNNARLEIRQKVHDTQRLGIKIDISKKNQRLLQRKFEIAQQQFENGLLSLEEFVEARKSYVEGIIDLWNSYSNYKTAVWDIEKLVGIAPSKSLTF